MHSLRCLEMKILKFSVRSQQRHTLAIYDIFAANMFNDCVNLTVKSCITFQLQSLATAVEFLSSHRVISAVS